MGQRARQPVAMLATGLVTALVASLAAVGCSTAETPEPSPPTPTPTPTQVSPSTSSSPSTSGRDLTLRRVQGERLAAAPGTVPPAWLGTRALPVADDGFGVRRATPPALRQRRFTLPDRLAALPGEGFAARVSAVPDRVAARSTWRAGCPVELADLRWVRLTFRGFDGARHTGELLVAAPVARDVVEVFRRLWRADFPLEEMRVVRSDELDAPPYGDGNNTSAFVCRASVGSPTEFSAHAFGLAIDVNPFQNPYVRADLVLPERATAYVDRSRRAPGMVRASGPVVEAFASVGWPWGGQWQLSKDWQHFSATGR